MNAETVIGLIGFGISVIGIIVTAINHTRIRSNCFGRKLELSIDVEKTTPVSKSEAFPRLPESPVAVAKTSCVNMEEPKVDIN
jgi:hypothetical protein